MAVSNASFFLIDLTVTRDTICIYLTLLFFYVKYKRCGHASLLGIIYILSKIRKMRTCLMYVSALIPEFTL